MDVRFPPPPSPAALTLYVNVNMCGFAMQHKNLKLRHTVTVQSQNEH